MTEENITIKKTALNPDGSLGEPKGMYHAMAISAAAKENRQRFKYNYTAVPEHGTVKDFVETIELFVKTLERNILNMEQSVYKLPTLGNTATVKEKCLPILKAYVEELKSLSEKNIAAGTLRNKGGMFAFPLETKLNWDEVLNFISGEYVKWMKHIYNQEITNALLRIYQPKDCYGCTMGRDFLGKWKMFSTTNPQTFNERSVTVDCVGVDEDILHRIAKEIFAAFKPTHIIVKSFDSGNVCVVEGKFSGKEQPRVQQKETYDEYFTEKEGIRYFNIEMLYAKDKN